MSKVNFSLLYFSIFYLLGISILQAQEQVTKKKIIFGKTVKSKSDIAVTSILEYNTTNNYGFDFNTSESVVFKNDGIISNNPFYFSVKLPEGNYKINLVLGSQENASATTVKAESRRLILNQVKLSAGETISKSFVVNVRTPRIDAEKSINIKDREINYLNWDDKLTLEFLGTSAIQSIEITPITEVTTLFLAGDSTVTDQDLAPWASWGQLITQYFNDEIVVANYAASGASLSSFKGSRRLEKIKSLLKPGDYLFIEFGHNDEKRKGEGIGPWQSYSNLLTEYITAARNKGAIPVLVTPTQRRFFGENNKLKPTHGEYPDAMRAVAKKMNVPLIDVTKMSTTLYETWGDADSRKAFVQYPANTFPGQTTTLKDNTHFNYFGANEIALCVVKGIKDLKLEIRKSLLDSKLKYKPKSPNQFSDWNVPMSLRFEAIKPDGN